MIRFNLLFLAVLSFTYAAQDSVQVQVYYETLCPDSVDFIVNQLHSTYQTLGSKKIKLELIPYGKASETLLPNGTIEFTCQHGPRECYGNKVHACAIKFANSIEEAEKFVYCSEKGKPSNDISLKRCAEESNISWNHIDNCLPYYGQKLLSINGKTTANIPLTFVPSVVIDGKFNEDDVRRATHDFKGLVCDKLGSEHQECK